MIEFRLPSLGSDMDEGKLLEWRVKPGDAVKKGDIVAVVDTTKAAIDVECWHDGIVHALLVEPDTTIPVGTPMAALREPGESAEAADAQLVALRAAAPQPALAAVAAAEPAARPVALPAAPSAAHAAERRAISPAALKRAAELGVDLAAVKGSGDGGAISLADVEAAAVRAPPSKPDAMRRTIAAAMARSKREIPHYYLAEDVPLAHALQWLAAQNAARPITGRLLLAPLLIQAVARALLRHPEFNGFYRDGAWVPGEAIHVGVAISLRAGGLIAPALLDVPTKDIDTLNRDLLDLVARTRAGSLKSSELGAPTITVTNLGDQGVGTVFPVITPPQVAIVGFGRVAERPWVIDGAVRATPMLTATLAADHRVSDGHRGGLFLAAVRDLLQQPEPLAQAQP
jgi:pyruvate dehydrogenase E2 component (dihydrolipoamide acetyltransferase)